MSDHATSTTTAAAASAIALLGDAFRGHTKLSAPVDDASTAATAVAWTIRVLRTAEAVAVLHEQGLGDVGEPMARSVMEHAVSLLWLIERRAEAVKAIEFGHRRDQRLLRDSATAGGWDLSGVDESVLHDDLDRGIVEPSEWPRLKNFEQRALDPTTRSWYAAFRLLSNLSHASYLSGAVYVCEDGGFSWEPVVPPIALRSTAIYAVIATEALTAIVDAPQLAAAAVKAKKVLGIGDHVAG